MPSIGPFLVPSKTVPPQRSIPEATRKTGDTANLPLINYPLMPDNASTMAEGGGVENRKGVSSPSVVSSGASDTEPIKALEMKMGELSISEQEGHKVSLSIEARRKLCADFIHRIENVGIGLTRLEYVHRLGSMLPEYQLLPGYPKDPEGCGLACAYFQAVTCKLLDVDFFPDSDAKPEVLVKDSVLRLVDKAMRAWVELVYDKKIRDKESLRAGIESHRAGFLQLKAFFPRTIRFLLRSDPDFNGGEQAWELVGDEVEGGDAGFEIVGSGEEDGKEGGYDGDDEDWQI